MLNLWIIRLLPCWQFIPSTFFFGLFKNVHELLTLFTLKLQVQKLRRLAQNREAARKSRLRKKVLFSRLIYFSYSFFFLVVLVFWERRGGEGRRRGCSHRNFWRFVFVTAQINLIRVSFAGLCSAVRIKSSEADATRARAWASKATSMGQISFPLSS